MNQVKITSLKTGQSYVFNTKKNLSEAILLKQKAYDKWRRNKTNNRHQAYYDIMKEGNYKIEYADEEEDNKKILEKKILEKS